MWISQEHCLQFSKIVVAFVFLLQVLMFSACDNGVYQREQLHQQKRRLFDLGKFLGNAINENQKSELKTIASKAPNVDEFTLVNFENANLVRGELIFLSNSKSPTKQDLFSIFVFSNQDENLGLLIMDNNLEVTELNVGKSQLREWFDAFGGKNQSIEEDISDLRESTRK